MPSSMGSAVRGSMLCCFVLGGVALGAAPASAGWEVFSKQDIVTDVVTHYATIHASEFTNAPKPPKLQIECRNDIGWDVAVFFYTQIKPHPTNRRNEKALVWQRQGSSDAQKSLWNLCGDAIDFWTPMLSQSDIRGTEIANALGEGKYIFRVISVSGGYVDAIFGVKGAARALSAVSENCGYDASKAAEEAKRKENQQAEELRRKLEMEETLAKHGNIEGLYSVEGKGPTGTVYRGICEVTALGGNRYRFEWNAGGSFSGSGKLEGLKISVDWGGKGAPIDYTLQSDGSLMGTYANGGASETLRRYWNAPGSG